MPKSSGQIEISPDGAQNKYNTLYTYRTADREARESSAASCAKLALLTLYWAAAARYWDKFSKLSVTPHRSCCHPIIYFGTRQLSRAFVCCRADVASCIEGV